MILPDIGNEEIAGLLVEVELVRIAQAVSPDLRLGADLDVRELLLGHAEQEHEPVGLRGIKRIVGGNQVRNGVIRHVHVDAQKLTPPVVDILSGIERIAFPSTITTAT